jgi:hypothetical protein
MASTSTQSSSNSSQSDHDSPWKEALEQQRMPYITTVEQAGIEKGVKQGVKQGEARTLLRQMERKFGPEAVKAHRERIETADIDQLEAWLDRILIAETPETIFH